jgi:hypothetical protein
VSLLRRRISVSSGRARNIYATPPRLARLSRPIDRDSRDFAGEMEWQGRCPFDGHMARQKKNPHAMALGRLGGLKGGRARAEKLSARRRREIARKAAEARWRQARAA